MTIFEETFVSPFEKDTKEEAYVVLQKIREAHPAEKGWEEIRGFTEQLPNGKWRAVRHHRKIS